MKTLDREYWGLLLATLLGNIGSSVLSFVLGLHILQTLDSVFLYGLSQSIGPVISLLLLPILGSVVDKYNRKKIVLVAQVFSVLTLFLFLVLFSASPQSIFPILLLLIGLKLADQFLTTALGSSIVGMVEEEKIQVLKSQQQVCAAISMLASPIIAVLVFKFLSLTWAIGVEIIIEGLVFLILLALNFQKYQATSTEVADGDKSLLLLFKEGIDFIRSYQKIIFGLVFALSINTLLAVVNVGLPIVQLSILNLSETTYALTDILFGVGLLAGSILAGLIKTPFPLNFAKNAILSIGLGTVILGFILSFQFSELVWLGVFGSYYILVGAAITLCNILLSSWSAQKVPQDFQGRVLAVMNTLSQTVLPLAILIFTFFFKYLPATFLFTVSGFFLFLTTLFLPRLMGVNLKNNELT